MRTMTTTTTTTTTDLFDGGQPPFRDLSEARLKRHLSERGAVDYVEKRRRNKENGEDPVPRASRGQGEGWLRVRNHVVSLLLLQAV
jgi:hypothetical protein